MIQLRLMKVNDFSTQKDPRLTTEPGHLASYVIGLGLRRSFWRFFPDEIIIDPRQDQAANGAIYYGV